MIRDQIEAIEEERAKWEAALITGSYPTFDQYKHTVGIIKGLNLALDCLRNHYKKLAEG